MASTLREELLADIHGFVHQWRDNPDPPPASVSELIVMALALHDEPITTAEVLPWVVGSFKHYRDGLSRALCPRRRKNLDGSTFIVETLQAMQDPKPDKIIDERI